MVPAAQKTVVKEHDKNQCPMDYILKILMGPWTTYILWQLHSNGPSRFGQLKKQMPKISAKMLSERLKMLVEAGILIRTQEETIPPKVTYELSERGHDLNKVLDDLHILANRWAGKTGE